MTIVDDDWIWVEFDYLKGQFNKNLTFELKNYHVMVSQKAAPWWYRDDKKKKKEKT